MEKENSTEVQQDPESTPTQEPAEENTKETGEKKKQDEEVHKQMDEKYQNFIDQALKYKSEGNEFFKAGEWQKARSKYTRVFAYTKCFISGGPGGDGMVDMAMKAQGKGEIDETLKKTAKDLERDVNCNLSMVYIKEKNWAKAIEKATASLAVEENTKAYFRRGKAHAMKNDFESAYKDFEEGKKNSSPDDSKLFSDEIARTEQREKAYDKEMGKKYAGFLSK